jgi:hypothetical protein
MNHAIHVPPHVGSRWRLPSGNTVEVLPALTSSSDYVACKYTATKTISPADADSGVTLRTDFLERWGRPV